MSSILRSAKATNKSLYYSLVLGALILIDSAVTVKIGREANPLLLWVMNLFDLSLKSMMFWRTIFIWAAIYFLYRVGFNNKYLVIMYTALYAACLLTMT